MTIKQRVHVSIVAGMAFAAFLHACLDVFGVTTSPLALPIWVAMGATFSIFSTWGQR